MTDPSKGMVKSIDVELMYTYHQGTGCFNDISLVKNSPTSSVYKYNNSGYISKINSGTQTTWYKYDKYNNLIRAVSSDGDAVDYFYDSMRRVVCEINRYYGENITSETYSDMEFNTPMRASYFRQWAYDTWGQVTSTSVSTLDKELKETRTIIMTSLSLTSN